jgi:hypothetical protein
VLAKSSNTDYATSWVTPASAAVSSVFTRTGAVVAAAGDYTATQITNTPLGSIASTTVQAAIDELATEKEPALTAGTTGQYYRGDKSWQTLDKTAAGLGNVDNTSDATKNAASVTLTNKTISGASNTLSAIAQSSVTNLVSDLAAKAPVTDTSTLPLTSGTAAAGSSSSPSPKDHVHPKPFWGPEDHGLISWAYDPACGSTGSLMTAGTLYMVRVKVPKATTITNVCIYVTTAGGTLTSGQCFAGLYDSSRALLSATATQHTNWQTAGAQIMALSAAQSVAAGDYYVGFYSNGTTQPTVMRTISVNGGINIGLATANSRFATSSTGLTTTIPSTAAALTAFNVAYWAAVS